MTLRIRYGCVGGRIRSSLDILPWAIFVRGPLPSIGIGSTSTRRGYGKVSSGTRTNHVRGTAEFGNRQRRHNHHFRPQHQRVAIGITPIILYSHSIINMTGFIYRSIVGGASSIFYCRPTICAIDRTLPTIAQLSY